MKSASKSTKPSKSATIKRVAKPAVNADTKAATPAVPAPAKADDSAVRILKVASCASASGKSKLTYHVGCDARSAVHFRVFGNTGTGFFSNEWVSLVDIENALARKTANKAITSFLLQVLFKGKSINTPAFLLAALKNEGMLQPSPTAKRCFERTDRSAFHARMQALVNGPSDVKAKGASSAPKGKLPTSVAAAKKPSKTSKKSGAK